MLLSKVYLMKIMRILEVILLVGSKLVSCVHTCGMCTHLGCAHMWDVPEVSQNATSSLRPTKRLLQNTWRNILEVKENQ